VTISGTTAQTATLTAATTSATTTGNYTVTITGTSGSITETTTACVAVSSSTSGCTNTTSGTSGNFYILNSTTISGYNINAGTLTALTNSPYALPSGVIPMAMAVDPTGSFLYVSTNNGIYLYTIGTGGALTLAQSSYVVGDSYANAIQVDKTGNWLLDASSQGGIEGALFAYQINPSTGVPLTGVSNPSPVAFTTGGVPQQMAISPDNNLIAVALYSAGTETFPFTAGNTGSTSPFSRPYVTKPIGSAAYSVAFAPQTKFLYIGETSVSPSSTTDSAGLRAISISGDVPGSDIAATPYASGGTRPAAILADSTGAYVYVANWVENSTGNITGFKVISGATPSLSLMSSTFATGAEPSGLAEDNTNAFVLAVSTNGGPDFNSYTFDTSTLGNLDSKVTSSSTGTSPIAIVAVPSK
jgi:6-phosphogluconolactonase (cycloisomerase 2 family)